MGCSDFFYGGVALIMQPIRILLERTCYNDLLKHNSYEKMLDIFLKDTIIKNRWIFITDYSNRRIRL